MEFRIYQEDAALLQTISLHEPGLCVYVEEHRILINVTSWLIPLACLEI